MINVGKERSWNIFYNIVCGASPIKSNIATFRVLSAT